LLVPLKRFAFEIYSVEQFRYNPRGSVICAQAADRRLNQKLSGSEQLFVGKHTGNPFQALIALLSGHCGEVCHNLEQLLPALEIFPIVSIRLDTGFGSFRDVRYGCRNAFRDDRNGYRHACQA
jgi:hypothetical protein